MKCYFCRKSVPITGRIGRRETCPSCGGDLHICRNCTFYDPSAYNECREPQSDRVLEKEASNFCDYFSAGEGGVGKQTDPAAEAKRKLEEMFKK